MKINGIDLNQYNAKLTGLVLSSSDFEIVNEWVDGSLLPFVSTDSLNKWKELDIKVEFKGDRETTNFNKSRFLSDCKNAVITETKFYNLIGFLEKASDELENGSYQVVNYKFKVIEEMAEVIEEVKNGLIFNPGTGLTPATMEVTPTTTGNIEIWLNKGTNDELHYLLKNMTTSTMRSISIETGIFEGATNKFLDTVIYTKFPRLIKGFNKVEVTGATVVFKFKPRII